MCRLNEHVQIASVWIKVETKVPECNQLLAKDAPISAVYSGIRSVG